MRPVVMVGATDPPATTLPDVGLAAIVKSSAGGVGLTVRLTVVEWVAEVAVPVTVIVLDAAGVELDVEIVIVDVPPLVTEAGLNDAVVPAGRPVADSVTLSAEPETSDVVIVDVAELPCVAEIAVGLAEMEKSLVIGPPQPGNLNDAMRVDQLNEPLALRYSLENQNVQLSSGSTLMLE
jgi:hypothetical protein